MNFIWRDSTTHYRCITAKPVQVTLRNTVGEYNKEFVQDMGYILPRDGRLMACIYGSVNPDALGKFFDNIDEAKRYVEEQALVGLTLNKLTR
jgi:hypothetical protein